MAQATGAFMQLGGGLIQAKGGIEADKAQIAGELANAQYFAEQERNIRFASQREEDIFERETEDILGEQRSIFAEAGITLTGTALEFQRQTQELALEEIEAIREFGRQNVRLSQIRERSARRTAKSIRDTTGLRATGTILGATGRSIASSGFDGNFSSSESTPETHKPLKTTGSKA